MRPSTTRCHTKTHFAGTTIQAIALVMAVVTATSMVTSTPTSAAGKDYYVDSIAGSDSNSGTSSSPWKTLSAINSRTFSAGDTISFKRGSSWTGNLTFKSSGAAGNPITLKAYGTGNAPVISYPNVKYGNSVDVYGSYVVVQDLLTRDANQAGVLIRPGSSNVTVQNIEVTNSGTGVYVQGTNVLVTGNYIHNLAMIVNTKSPTDDDYGAVGIWVASAANVEISHNRFVKCRASSYDYGFDGGVVEIWAGVNNLNVHHNYSFGANGFMEAGGKGALTNTTFAYNVSDRDYQDFAVLHVAGSFATTFGDFRIENNTIVNTVPGYRVLDSERTALPASVYFRNNVVYSATSFANAGGFTHNNNLYYFTNSAGLGSISPGPGEIQADPLFTSLGGGDYHLQAGSPAIDAGANLGYSDDFEGNTVPSGAAPDLGVYERVGSAAPTATPAPPGTVPPTMTPAPIDTSTPTSTPPPADTSTATVAPTVSATVAATLTPTPTASVPPTSTPSTTPTSTATVAPTPAPIDLAAGLVGYWRMDEGRGNTTADSSDSRNAGTLYNRPSWITGRSGKALSFNGSNQYVQVPDASVLSPLSTAGEITAAAWVNLSQRPSGRGEGRAPFFTKARSNSFEYALYSYASGEVGFTVWQLNGKVYEEVSGGSIPLNGWHHVVGTAKVGQYVRVYLDGALVAQATGPFSGTPGNGSSPLYFARRGDGQYLRESLDEVRLYGRVLSDPEIAALAH